MSIKSKSKKSNLKLAIALVLLAATVFAFFYTPKSSFAATDSVSQDSFVSVPYETMTVGPEGALVATQPAYVPSSMVSLSVSSSYGSLLNPEDMALDRDAKLLYIADTGNGRIVVTDYDGNIVSVFGKSDLAQPTGIAMDDEHIFVCDKSNKLVYIYNKSDYSLHSTIDKPDNPLVGANTDFVPTKIAVDGRENLYIVSEGSVSGLMQVNLNGDFIGYIGSNETEVSFLSILQNLFFSNDQKNAFLKTPRSPTGVTIDRRGLVYTVTNNATSATVKKLNTLGNSIMSPSQNFAETCAACIDASENIYTVQTNGYVTIFDSEGNMLFRFGGARDERFGSLSNPSAVQVLDDGRVMVLDKNYAMVVVYSRTEFAKLVFKAVDYYKDGLYLAGEESWQEVLQYNSGFILAYKALARANMKKENYDLALSQFKYAEDKSGYSEAFWQIRNDWLEENLVWVIALALSVLAVVLALKFMNRRTTLLAPVNKGISAIKNFHIKNVYPLKELKHTGRFCKATGEAVYEVKYHKAASVWIALILYLWLIVLQILSVYTKGYLFNSVSVYSTNGWNTVLIIAAAFLLLVLCNYFVSTVSDGEGKLKHCFISFIYALSPYLIMALPVFIITNVLTYNESIVYYILEVVMYGWSVICVFLAIMELHDYTVWQAIKNLFLTLFAFLMVILFAIVMRMLLTQLFGYIGAVFEEVFNNVI